MTSTLDAATSGATAGAGAPTTAVAAVDRPHRRGGRARRLDALDGLRTIAVLLVLAFHLDVPGFSGGFLGVDVFFVLSGFLITSLLLKEISHRGRVDLGRFWMRRVLRLLPASLLVIVTVLVWAAVEAPPLQRQSVGVDALWSLVYVANWRFIATAGYFADDGTVSPLQHVWSLAVEEQFYLLWPLLLTVIGTLAVARYRGAPGAAADSADRAERTASRRRVVGGLTLALSGGLALVSACLLAWHYDPAAAERAYMGTDTKAFEPLIGAATAALLLRHRVRTWVADHAQHLMLLGLGAIAVGVALLGGEHAPVDGYYRGGSTAFALVCAVLVAATSLADRRHGLTLVLGSTPVSYIGRISYGVYLWHWPLIVAFIADRGFEPVRAAGVAAATVLLASLSYHLVEHPIRTGRIASRSPVRVLAPAGVAVGLAVASTSQLGGSPLNRLLPPVLDTAPAVALDRQRPAAGSIMLVGDSVMSRLSGQLAIAGQDRGLHVVNAARGGCSATDAVVLNGKGEPNRVCERMVPQVQAEAMASIVPGTIVWWSRYELADRLDAAGNRLVAGTPQFWAAQRASMTATIERLTGSGAQLVMVEVDRAGVGMDTRCTPQACDPFLRRLRDDEGLRTAWNTWLRELAARDDRVSVIAMDDVYCRGAANPCDDTLPIDGPADAQAGPARPDGSHFAPAAMPQVAAALLDRVTAAR